MAVLDSVPGLIVEFTTNGVALREYADGEDETNSPQSVTKYIEVRADDAFGITTHVTDDFVGTNDIFVELRVDGTRVGSRGYFLAQLRKEKGTIEGVWSKIGGIWNFSRFRFSSFVGGK